MNEETYPALEEAREKLAQRIVDRITQEGPVPIHLYMAEALFDPMGGFYATKDPLGAGADFITAPEISQMFGELIGLWVLQCWDDLGRPDPFNLIELGPGKGTMMADALRAARMMPDFLAATTVTLVEASPALKMVQGQTLSGCHVPLNWADSLEKAPQGPAIILGNEFLDCLPIRQALRHEGAWYERCIALDPAKIGKLAFYRGPQLAEHDIDLIPAPLRDAPEGSLVEIRPGDHQVIEALKARFAHSPGRALFIDYGPCRSEAGDSLQALRAHEKVSPLDRPGTADLTAHVDFAELSRLATSAGLEVQGPVVQEQFLKALGIESRAATLMGADDATRDIVIRQAWRLLDPTQMGHLFKVISLAAPGLKPAPGFGADDLHA
ncbi:class I SAM-dependent methyltransferase [Woodsholea maritima]|uniref:class I SAM-dependent methyltransferase n=1 Tax=Woodsholea maritima TaxID=240237 RepID=UPI000366FFF6|nr:SAM-dependent methyltransferase [Woodsholea maritima]